jgi:CheY-like chemotaxis protein
MTKEVAHQNTSVLPRILLVDDNKLGLVARKSVLEELGYSISTAAHGEEALAQFTNGGFDLIITDYKMPKMDGLQLIVRIREQSPDVPIILISGYADALGLTESNTGADAVIAKSANEVHHLVRSVSRLLRRTAPKKPTVAQRVQPRLKRHGAY